MHLTYAELFAGAGGLSMGLEMAGWRCLAHAEIEPHARAVLRYKWPDVRLDGDVSAINGADYAGVTLLSGGSPCQDLSIAGKRKGLGGERSGLFHQQVRIWRESGAPLFLWENVLGALSSNKGEDFGVVLSTIVGGAVPVPADGWGGAGVASGPAGVAAWRVLDGQFFGRGTLGTPQRRRRVFVLGVADGSVDPAEVLSLSESLSGHFASGREAGEGVAAGAGDGIEGALNGWDSQRNRIHGAGGIAPTLQSPNGRDGQQPAILPDADSGAGVEGAGREAVAFKAGQSEEAGATFVTPYAPTLQGSANGSTMVPAVLTYPIQNPGVEKEQNGLGIGDADAPMFTLEQRGHGVVTCDTAKAVNISAGIAKLDDTMGTLGARSGGQEVGAQTRGVVLTYDTRGNGDGQVVNTMAGDHQNRVTDYTAVVLRNREGKPGGGKGPLVSAERSLTLGTSNDQVVFPTLQATDATKWGSNQWVQEGKAYIEPGIGVPRRLTPLECERLMSWGDGWTERGIDEQGREYALSDTARYKLCGNGVLSACVAWIGMRLKDALDTPRRA